MERPTRLLRPFVAIFIVLVMVTSASASAIGPLVSSTMGPTHPPTWQERLGITHQQGTSTQSSTGSRAVDLEDQFEVVSPYPTSRNIYDLKFKPNSNTALAVGEQGLIMEYDGVYFNTITTSITANLWAVS